MDYLVPFGILLVIPTVFAGLEQCPGNIQRNRNLRLYGSSCYEFVLSHPVDWGHADQDCKVKGGYLVDIHTRDENYFIYRTLRELGYVLDEGVWIGLTDQERESNWHWSHLGTPLNYKNWASGQPGILGTFEDCVILQASDGKWHDYPCSGFLFSTERHGWVCKYNAAAPVASTTPPTVTRRYETETFAGNKMSAMPDTNMMTSDMSNAVDMATGPTFTNTDNQ